MSNQKNGNAPWGKTSRFTYKTTAKRNPAITKEEKEKFLLHGILPKFKSTQKSEKWLQKKYSVVETDLLQEATTVINKVRDEFGIEGGFTEAAYGKRICVNRASEVIHNYLVEHGIDGMMSVYFTSEMDCSGKMQWTGPMNKYNQPERRNYSMWVKTTSDNIYFRETGILNLTNHEIGTHFLRSLNDGLQIWFANRTKFGLCPYKAQALKDTEEGLAALNTAFEAKVKYLWGPAMLYYTACMSLEMNFKELFEHLGRYVSDPEIRWKYVVRVKRGRTPTQLGGSGKDQCYFRGIVNILRNVDSINFLLLYSGKITVEDQSRVQRLARLGCIKTPYFLKDMNGYRRYMKSLLRINGIPKSKPLPRELDVKLNVPKTPRMDGNSKLNNNNNNNNTKKSPRAQMLEARERIMSTQLLSKKKKILIDDSGAEEKVFGVVDQTLMIEYEYDEPHDDILDIPLEGDKEDPEGEISFGHSSLTLVESEKPPDVTRQVFVTGGRRNDSHCSSLLKTCSSEDKDSHEEGDSGRSDKTGCTDAFCIPNKKPEKLRLTKQQKEPVSNSSLGKQDKIENIIKNSNLKDEGIEKNNAVVPSCASRVSTPIKLNPNAALQLVREIPSTPKPNMYEIRSSTARKTPVHETMEKCFQKRSTPTPDSVRKSSSGSRTSSTTIASTPKRSLKKNLSLFFEDLIPFSKSRRKRVLPHP